MRRFAALYSALDASSGTTAKVGALAAYFDDTDAADAAWALHVLLGKQGKRLITGRRLREICLADSSLPEWLFDDCYAQVGDSAETIALLWRQLQPEAPAAPGGRDGHGNGERQETLAAEPLHRWLEELLPAAAALEGEAQAEAVRELWLGLSANELLVANKLLTGGLRVGVGPGLVLRALAQLSGLETALLQHRLMGGFSPSPQAYRHLLAPANQTEAVPSRPYPFFLASPLEDLPPGAAEDWLAEWKFDGIRGQLIRRAGQAFLWSRGEELINGAFPELIAAAACLPEGTVLDGEVLVWPQGSDRPAPFGQLQRRLGRKAPGRALLAACPAAFVAYDLLEWQGDDWRQRPLRQRRAALESLISELQQATPTPAAGLLRLSPRLPLTAWDQLEPLRQQAAAAAAEGLMLKDLDSPYRAGRRRGAWWKHKRDPYTLDAVLLYAQAGSGRRANLFTDYSFGLWDGDGRLVTFAKAYSGLDDGEITALDRWIRQHTTERFGPVRAVEPLQVFELAFEGLQQSPRHKSGLAVRFPRIRRWRHDKPAQEADTLATALALLERGPC
ncbi:ATP-dependent DNA ligase [Cyanobium sp. FACHB-13342]|uniref:ATP-dependent DNA ligase n=1 Tax=Cyanobium sp. FACHB-13342 TaxID=2692793 RepID=UPI00167FE9A6|nr:ATP-dependent DNA ligase [Cyanobium sp. FACHB-13342]MBD2423028.1 ATP-dependent DNA ligase [Cyanobium sp. FACHB-13342]